MQVFKAALLSLIFWNLTFSPIAFAGDHNSSSSLTDVIKYYNSKNLDGSELVKLVRDNDQSTYKDLTAYLEKNGIVDLKTIPTGTVQLINNKKYKISVDKKDFIITQLDTDRITVAYKNKSTTLSFKEGNMDQWVNALNTINSETITFNWLGLFINDAHAISYLVIAVVGVVLVALGVKYYANTLPLDQASSRGNLSCNDVNDATKTEKDEVKIRNSHAVLSSVYVDKCTSRPSTNKCVEANRIMECLSNFLNPERQLTDAQRENKPSDGISNGTNQTGASTTQK